MCLRIIRSIGIIILLMGLLAWGVHAVKLNPTRNQVGPYVLIGAAEVLDVRTSLRWQQTPGAPGDTVSACDNGNACTWQEAKDYCEAAGNGSRLPKQRELINLIDYSAPSPGPFLAAGHPFHNVQSAFYWSATPNLRSPVAFWDVPFNYDYGLDFGQTAVFPVWCVRGGQSFDGHTHNTLH